MHKDFLDLISKNKFWIFAFFISFIAFLVYYFKSSGGLFFDIPSMFANILLQMENPDNIFYMFIDRKVRVFSAFLVMIPFNVLSRFFIKDSVLNLITVFSLSYYIVQFVLILFNLYVSKLTKRYDIFALVLIFYAVFCLPNAVWSVRESHISILVYFSILSFFLSRVKLNRFHLFFIIPLLLYLFESFEITCIFGLILFFSSIFYFVYKKDDINVKYKIFIGVAGLLSSIYIPLKLFYIVNICGINAQQGLYEWLSGIKISFLSLFSSNLIIFVFGISAFVFLVFYKKFLDKKSLIFVIPFFLIMLTVLYFKTGFVPNPGLEISFFGISFVFIFPYIIAVILVDYFNFEFNKYFYSNILILACVIGMFNMFWQFLECNLHREYISYLKNLKKESTKTIIEIPIEDYKKYDFLNKNLCYSLTSAGLYLSDKRKVNHIFVPGAAHGKYEYCAMDETHTFYDKENKMLVLQNSWYRARSKYYDLRPIITEFENLGMVKKQ